MFGTIRNLYKSGSYHVGKFLCVIDSTADDFRVWSTNILWVLRITIRLRYWVLMPVGACIFLVSATPEIMRPPKFLTFLSDFPVLRGI